MKLHNLLPCPARCAYRRTFVDGVQRQCPDQIGWFARLFGAIFCLQHEELPDLD